MRWWKEGRKEAWRARVRRGRYLGRLLGRRLRMRECGFGWRIRGFVRCGRPNNSRVDVPQSMDDETAREVRCYQS